MKRYLALFLTLATLCPALNADVCQKLSPSTLANVRVYLAKRLHRDISSIRVVADPGNPKMLCFIHLSVTDSASKDQFDLYLSPDNHFVTSELYDVRIDPLVEQRKHDADVAAVLKAGASATRGPRDGPIQIVEFIDFQCPYCRGLQPTLDKLIADNPSVELIYRAFPLPMHSWALTAATMAACVHMQSSDAFWRLYKQLFINQQSITPGNIHAKVAEWLANDHGIKMSDIDTCMSNGKGRAMVDADIALGRAHEVDGTPTSFVNGVRVVGAIDIGEFETMIQDQGDGKTKTELPASGRTASAVDARQKMF